MNLTTMQQKYPSKRTPVYGHKGMVATSQPLAAQTGLEILKKGGNAVDAAIATAACLTVVEPTSNGIGGDAFAIVWMNEKLYGYNGSGKSPGTLTIEALKEQGLEEIPKHGMIPVTVPGAPETWRALSEKFGNLSLLECLEPAIRYAEEGFSVSTVTSKYWRGAEKIYRESLLGDEFREWFKVFAKDGNPPGPGEIWKLPDHGKTLRSIGESDAKDFYEGDIAERVDLFSKTYGGFITKADLQDHRGVWVEPVNVHYKGVDVWELPPNGQGIIALMALNIVKNLELHERDHPETYHRQIEALKLAFEDGKEYITDPSFMGTSVEALLSDKYGQQRADLIKDRALLPKAGKPEGSGTVYLATADGDGNMVSFIQSNYMGFGSGIVIPGTGISLQNRGHNFSMDPNAENALSPGKRTYHTIIPGFLTKKEKAIGPFGVMGGFMQPQGHMQMINNLIDFGLNPQEALDAPRWQWIKDKIIELEAGTPEFIFSGLKERGHQVTWAADSGSFGRGQMIFRVGDGFIGATEPRTDGMVASW